MNTRVLIFTLAAIFFSCATEVKPPAPVYPIPTPSQLEWHDVELSAFIHFSINTFTDKEWGYGDESPSLFNPTQLNAEQWVTTLRDAGFKCLILTCKHHDGFCLWPSQYTDHSVANSPYKNGKGDIVKEVSGACKKYGLKFGVYLSPWDRNHAGYGSTAYITYYRNQLEELFTSYDPIFEMWFDGANGGDGFYGGANETRKIDGATYYDWPTTLSLVRELNPEVIFFSDAGPGVRWVGNERGAAGETNWNTITPDTLFAGKPGIEKLLNTGNENGTQWIPAEVDVSIRPGWFYHESQDSLVKTPERLFEIYLTSVGRGSTLLLNVPPDKRGLLHENDVAVLKAWRQLIDREFNTNLARSAKVMASNYRGNLPDYAPSNLVDDDPATYWATDDDIHTGNIEFSWDDEKVIEYVVIKEHIELGQRVREFTIEAWDKNEWTRIYLGTTIGHKRIIQVQPTLTDKLRIHLLDAKACPVICNVEVY